MSDSAIEYIHKLVKENGEERHVSVTVSVHKDGKMRLNVCECPVVNGSLQFEESESGEITLTKVERRKLIKALSKGL